MSDQFQREHGGASRANKDHVLNLIGSSDTQLRGGSLVWAIDYAAQAWSSASGYDDGLPLDEETILAAGNQLAKVAKEARRRLT